MLMSRKGLCLFLFALLLGNAVQASLVSDGYEVHLGYEVPERFMLERSVRMGLSLPHRPMLHGEIRFYQKKVHRVRRWPFASYSYLEHLVGFVPYNHPDQFITFNNDIAWKLLETSPPIVHLGEFKTNGILDELTAGIDIITVRETSIEPIAGFLVQSIHTGPVLIQLDGYYGVLGNSGVVPRPDRTLRRIQARVDLLDGTTWQRVASNRSCANALTF